MMSRRGRVFLGVSAVCLAVGASVALGQSLTVTVTPITAHADEGEGPSVVAESTPTPTPTPTPTVEVVEPSAPITLPSTTGEDPASAPAEEGPLVEWHAMDEGPLICGPDAKPALDYNEHTGWGWWAYCEPALVTSDGEGPPLGYLPECEQEDSDNCIWYADSRGNGEGRSFIAYEGQVWYLDG